MVEGGEAHADQVGTGLVLLEGSATGGSERVPTGQDSAVDDATPARGPEIGHTPPMNVRWLVLGGALPDEGGDTAFDREEFHDPQPDADDRPARPVISILDSRPKDSACG